MPGTLDFESPSEFGPESVVWHLFPFWAEFLLGQDCSSDQRNNQNNEKVSVFHGFLGWAKLVGVLKSVGRYYLAAHVPANATAVLD
jgi:hypothetical protein